MMSDILLTNGGCQRGRCVTYEWYSPVFGGAVGQGLHGPPQSTSSSP